MQVTVLNKKYFTDLIPILKAQPFCAFITHPISWGTRQAVFNLTEVRTLLSGIVESEVALTLNAGSIKIAKSAVSLITRVGLANEH